SGGGVSNLKPVADAGADQTLKDTDNSGSETVILNGGASSDSDGTIVSYSWNEGTAKLGNGAQLTLPLSVGIHNITLTVTDDDADTGSDSMVVIVNAGTPSNRPPVANAGADQTLTDNDQSGGEAVTLDGRASNDPDGSIVSYVWREGSATLGSTALLSVNRAVVGIHNITLTVTDNAGATSSDSVTVTVKAGVKINQPPVANAGGNQQLIDANRDSGEVVTINGGGSYDPDGSIANYNWKLNGIALPNHTAAWSAFLGVGATYTVELIVTDNQGAVSTANTIQIKVLPGSS
ncbi:MAG: PKD domain-containing protein, partial [Methylococcales bacterium]